MDQNNVKQEPEATFLLILPQASVQQPINEIKIEQNSAKIKVKIRKFDQRRKRKMKLFQTYQKCEKCDLVVTYWAFKWHRCYGNQRFKCDHCGRFFRKRSNLSIHMEIHAKEYSFFCGKCGEGFKQRKRLASHQKTNNRMTKCNLCDKEFECKNLKDQHTREVHKKNLKCTKCDFVAEDFRKLQSHQRFHNKQSSCETCSKKFRSPYQLKTHQLQHKHGIYKDTSITFDCDHCAKSFATSEYLKRHQEYSHSKEKFQCDFCSKILVSKPSLIQHMKNHIKVPCHICKKIISKSKLNIHLKSHSKPSHKCSKCKKSFTRRDSLFHHIKSVHSKLSFQCDLCGKTFKSRHSLLQHFDNHKKVPCSICRKIVNKSSLKKHLWRHSRVIRCKFCSLKFNFKPELYYHVKKKHSDKSIQNMRQMFKNI